MLANDQPANAGRSEYAAWEQAEVARSRTEASLTRATRLRISERTRQRYMNPPLGTAYPLEYAYALLGDVRGRDVLDLGCGSGANTVLLALRGARVCGLDLSSDLVDLARQRLVVNAIRSDVRFIVGSAHAIDLPDSSVDVVFGMVVLHHLDLERAASETLRVLKPGGRAVFQEPVRNLRLIWALRRMIPYCAPAVSPYERPLTGAELLAFARRFRSFHARAFALPHVALARVVPAAKRYIDAAYRLDRRLLALKPLAHFAGVRVFEVTK
jgi:SAM-dependent methyltransferase